MLVDVHAHNNTSIVEQIAVSTKSPVNNRTDLCQRWSLQNHSSNKGPPVVVLRYCAVDENGFEDVY
jgi:hypothetical protein